MQRGIGMLTSREVSLHCENNRLRKGLVIAERELSAMFREGKPSWTCEKAIKEIREALKGGEK
jgi:hypothetical protein